MSAGCMIFIGTAVAMLLFFIISRPPKPMTREEIEKHVFEGEVK